MSMLKKLLAFTLALAMVLSVSAFAGYSADTYADADKINGDCKNAVELLYALDIMKGDGKNFNPEATVTRAEMAKMIYVVLNKGNDDGAKSYTGAKLFTDVAAGEWYEGYVNYAGATKLVQGRPDGTFGPKDPVTTAEAAKMLLTAIGYSAEARGYVGAKWAENVLSDAAIIGLLKGYEANVNGYAPRQWVAVMMSNCLLNAYTYTTMAPTFSGLLTSGDEFGSVVKMGTKYYGLDEIEGVAIATLDAYIDTAEATGDTSVAKGDTTYADKYEVLIAADDGEVYAIRGTGLKAADLGQTYRVIYKTTTSTAYDGTAYSVRSLYETAEARTLDMDVDVAYGISGKNQAKNRYEFTIGDLTAKFAASEIPVLYSGVNEESDGVPTTVSVSELREKIETPDRNNNIWKAITDEDGYIAYFYVTEYAYATVTDDGNHRNYGDYIVAEDLHDGDLEFNGETRLYLEACIISEDEIVEDNIVKYTWSLDDGMYVMEVLPFDEEVEYTSRAKSKVVYELGGDDYMIADLAVDGIEDDLNDSDNLGELFDIVYDGDLLVWSALSGSVFTDIADVNAQLVLVLDAMDEYSNNKIREQNAIEYMTIDGETHIAAYQDGEELDFTDIDHLADVLDTTKRDDDETDWENDEYFVEGRLFILHEGTKGRVYLEAIVEDDARTDDNETADQFTVSTSVLDNFKVVEYGELDTEGSSAKLDGDKMAGDNVFFYGYFNSYGEAVYGVYTPNTIPNGVEEDAYAQVLTLDNAKGTRTTVVAGYVFAPEMVDESDDGYLFIDEILRETADGQKAKVTFLDGETAEIEIDDYDVLVEGYMYSYNYNVVDEVYDIVLVDMDDSDEEIVDIDGTDVIFDGRADLDIEDYTVAIVTIEIGRDENAAALADEADFFEYVSAGYEIKAYDEVELEEIENDTDETGYVQYTDWAADTDEEVLYVFVWSVMDRYTGENLNDSPLTLVP